ncbi:hypothetical protein NDU88_006388 [Pleurodeles waltl]|uniref:Uncharacterized protein n=1 Tax=Pleurodeles waltl TaxID=8319 RepID=A0AAV7N0P7_PLEWA|nr:hypothetical protein NDU88_006388 [Pleurodeles waltl]
MVPWQNQAAGGAPAGQAPEKGGLPGYGTKSGRGYRKGRQTPTDKQDNAKEEGKQKEKVPGQEEPSAKGTDPRKAWVGGVAQGTGVGKPASAYIRPSLGDSPIMAREAGLANLIPLAVKERIGRKEFIAVFSLFEVRQGGLDFTTHNKKDEDRRTAQAKG